MTKKLRITINGESFDVTVETLEGGNHLPSTPSAPAVGTPVASAPLSAPVAAAPRPAAPVASGGGLVPSPMSGRLVSYGVKAGDEVAVGDVLATVEAMKMNTYVHAEVSGRVAELLASVGDGVEEGQALLRIA